MKTLVIAPHADDEILGAGGTLFKRNSKTKNSIYWLLITMPGRPKYSKNFIKNLNLLFLKKPKERILP